MYIYLKQILVVAHNHTGAIAERSAKHLHDSVGHDVLEYGEGGDEGASPFYEDLGHDGRVLHFGGQRGCY